MHRRRSRPGPAVLPVAAVACLLFSTLARASEVQVIHLFATSPMSSQLDVVTDRYGVAARPEYRLSTLPDLELRLALVGDTLVPLGAPRAVTDHPYWDWVFSAGRFDGESGRLILPLSLQEKDANCLHNGVLTIAEVLSEAPPSAEFVIASESCHYLQFDLRLQFAIELTRSEQADVDDTLVAFTRHREQRLPRRALSALAQDFPGTDPQAFRGGAVQALSEVTTSGFVVEGVHYSSGCAVRQGVAPDCAELPLPSYSLAKSLVAGLALMALEKRYPGSSKIPVAELVPECRQGGNWDDVQLGHLLNMVTGNFVSREFEVDENSNAMLEGFFLPSQHTSKLRFSCDHWPRKAPPGETWVYHTSDTYLLGTAMNNLLKGRVDSSADFFIDLVLPLWAPLQLSPHASDTLRTRDGHRQPFTGYGLRFIADDLARLGLALLEGSFSDELDTRMYTEAVHPTAERDNFTITAQTGYHHGFWSLDPAPWLGCDAPAPVSFLSGYGGINLLLLPGPMVYYMVSDGGNFNLRDAIVAAHNIKALCDSGQSESSTRAGRSDSSRQTPITAETSMIRKE